MACLEVQVPNTLRRGKLESTVANVVDACKNGSCVLITNQGDFSTAVVEVVELAKKALREGGNKVFQTNSLSYNPVYTESNEQDPLKPQKIHHFEMNLRIKVSLNPIDVENNETVQVS